MYFQMIEQQVPLLRGAALQQVDEVSETMLAVHCGLQMREMALAEEFAVSFYNHVDLYIQAVSWRLFIELMDIESLSSMLV